MEKIPENFDGAATQPQNEKQGMMKRVCSWCKKDMGEKPGPDGQVTHGVCDECAKEMEEELEAMKK